MSVWVWVSWRFSSSHRNPISPTSTSSIVWPITLTWPSFHSNRASARSHSVPSSAGSAPNGRNVSSVSGSAVSVTVCVVSLFIESLFVLLDRGDASDLTWVSGYARARRKESAVDVRSIEDVAPVVEHNGTVPVWWMIKPGEMTEITKGGHLELVNEFDVEGGGSVFPHTHPTHEFYYVTQGRGIMTIEGEEAEVRQGDLVHIPPMAVHSLRPTEREQPHPLLLLRHRRRRRRRDQLHDRTESDVGRIEDELSARGITLAGPHPPHHPLVPVVVHDGVARTSGQLPRVDGTLTCLASSATTSRWRRHAPRRGCAPRTR